MCSFKYTKASTQHYQPILTVREVKVRQIPPNPFRERPRKINGERTGKTEQKCRVSRQMNMIRRKNGCWVVAYNRKAQRNGLRV